jgi:1,4-alpha-glucan branching enzyme
LNRERIAIICNFSPVPRANYRIGVPEKGFWQELVNTDAKQYGGSGRGNFGGVETVPVPAHGRPYSLTVDLPPLAAVYFRLDPNSA